MSKILPTIGPKTESIKNLKKVMKFSDFLRLNGSHNSLAWHRKISKRIKFIDPKTKILLDLPGIKPRTANKSKITIFLNEKVIFYFGTSPKNFKFTKIKTTRPIPKIQKKIKYFSLSDGKFLFHFVKKGQNYIIGRSASKFTLFPQKGINIPYSKYNEKEQLKIYIKFLNKYKKEVKFDAVGLSFVQTDGVVKIIKSKFQNLAIISKIENIEGLRELISISENSDGIMIDRGDLRAEIGDEKLFDSIVKISNECKKLSIPLIMGTGNLDSMLIRKSPTNSEIISLGFSYLLKTGRIMLSEETAVSENWEAILKWLRKYLSSLNKKKKKNLKKKENNYFWEIFKSIKDIPVILFTKKGYAIKNILNADTGTEFYIFTDNNTVDTINKLRANMHSILTSKFSNINLNKFIYENIKKNKKLLFKNSSKAALVYVANPRKNSRANTLQLVSKEDFK